MESGRRRPRRAGLEKTGRRACVDLNLVCGAELSGAPHTCIIVWASVLLHPPPPFPLTTPLHEHMHRASAGALFGADRTAELQISSARASCPSPVLARAGCRLTCVDAAIDGLRGRIARDPTVALDLCLAVERLACASADDMRRCLTLWDDPQHCWLVPENPYLLIGPSWWGDLFPSPSDATPLFNPPSWWTRPTDFATGRPLVLWTENVTSANWASTMEHWHASDPLEAPERCDGCGYTLAAGRVSSRHPRNAVLRAPVRSIDVAIIFVPREDELEVRRFMCGPNHYHYTYGHMAQRLADALLGTTARFLLHAIHAFEYYPGLDHTPGGWGDEGSAPDPSFVSVNRLWDPLRTIVPEDLSGHLVWDLDLLEVYVSRPRYPTGVQW